jgi:5'-nucleotidase
MKHIFWPILLFLSIISCKQNPTNLTRIEGKLIPVDIKINLDSETTNFILPYKDSLDSKMSKVLAYSPTDLLKIREKSETNIGNFMADLCYKQGNKIFNKKTNKNIDFVLLNFGGIRTDIPQGDVTVGNAYELMPFENNMVVAELTYQKIQELVIYLSKAQNAHPISKQLQLKFIGNSIESVLLNGKILNKNHNYYVLTSDYLQNGGNWMVFFKDPISLVNLDYKIRTAILDELKEIDTIRAKIDGRMMRY